jgi:hypothetical protein
MNSDVLDRVLKITGYKRSDSLFQSLVKMNRFVLHNNSVYRTEKRVSSKGNTTYIFTEVNICAHETVLKCAKKAMTQTSMI